MGYMRSLFVSFSRPTLQRSKYKGLARRHLGLRIRYCFFGGNQSKMVNRVVTSAAAQHIEARVKRRQSSVRQKDRVLNSKRTQFIPLPYYQSFASPARAQSTRAFQGFLFSVSLTRHPSPAVHRILCALSRRYFDPRFDLFD